MKDDQVAQKTEIELKELVQDALHLRRRAIVYDLAKRFYTLFDSIDAAGLTTANEEHDSPWSEIASLSQLRAVVGGRFKNLKEKWVAAGFPLREHRGDRSAGAELNYDAWIELSAWIHKQGFEVRLASDERACFFEVRKQADQL